MVSVNFYPSPLPPTVAAGVCRGSGASSEERLQRSNIISSHVTENTNITVASSRSKLNIFESTMTAIPSNCGGHGGGGATEFRKLVKPRSLSVAASSILRPLQKLPSCKVAFDGRETSLRRLFRNKSGIIVGVTGVFDPETNSTVMPELRKALPDLKAVVPIVTCLSMSTPPVIKAWASNSGFHDNEIVFLSDENGRLVGKLGMRREFDFSTKYPMRVSCRRFALIITAGAVVHWLGLDEDSSAESIKQALASTTGPSSIAGTTNCQQPRKPRLKSSPGRRTSLLLQGEFSSSSTRRSTTTDRPSFSQVTDCPDFGAGGVAEDRSRLITSLLDRS
eukprot:Lankesteria_metandrocarpae@DN6009_c0_g1_i1.p1